MANHSVLYTCLIVIFTGISFLVNWIAGSIVPAKPISFLPLSTNIKVLLIPLDSRPPCTQFVIELGRLAGIETILPPSEILDNYRQPAQQAVLRQWLLDNITQVDAAIISVDMLIHGGLLASRHAAGTDEDINQTMEVLQRIHESNPQLPLYVFSIIPRLLLADDPVNAPWQKPVMNYSILKNQLELFDNPIDGKKLRDLEDKIPPQVLQRYVSLYQRNIAINKRLIDLTAKGTIYFLALGQDDGQPFGLPNQAKEQLSQYVQYHILDGKKTIITRGTDEIALTLMGRYANDHLHWSPQVYVTWSHPKGPSMVMPFMPHSIARTVEEKLATLGATPVSNIRDADFVLYIHAGNSKTTPNQLKRAAEDVSALINQNYYVAIVDLTEDYYAHQTLFPWLTTKNVDLTKLASYAGWNTTSNSVGTALAQASIFTGRLHQVVQHEQLSLYAAQLTFLTNRFLDDWYYQKQIQPVINKELKIAKINPNLLGEHYSTTNNRINRLLVSSGDQLLRQVLAPKTITIETQKYRVNHFELYSILPWDRTFEIKITPVLSFVELQK